MIFDIIIKRILKRRGGGGGYGGMRQKKHPLNFEQEINTSFTAG